MGGAVGIPAAVIFAVVGGFVGNGSSVDCGLMDTSSMLHRSFNKDLPRILELATYLWGECLYYVKPRHSSLSAYGRKGHTQAVWGPTGDCRLCGRGLWKLPFEKN